MSHEQLPETGETPDKKQPAKGLRCPNCGCSHFRTEKTVDIPGRRRRRYKICRNCGRRVRTMETIETETL